MSSANHHNLMKKFQLNGLNVRKDALSLFEIEYQHHGKQFYQTIDDYIVDLIDIMLSKITCEDYIIDSEMAQKTIEYLRQWRLKSQQSTEIPNVTEKIVVKNSIELQQSIKLLNFDFHYQQLLKQLKKLPVFESGQFQLMTIDDLNTYELNIEIKCIVFAMIRQDPSRIMQFFLEDSTGRMPVQLNTHITWREWATFQNGIYLVEGTYEGQRDSFNIESIGLAPPASVIEETATEMNLIKNDDDNMLVLISDIHLDQSSTIEALKHLFEGYNSLQQIPDCFILIGNFSSKIVDNFEFKDNMKNLVKLISIHKNLSQNSKFVFVPGPNDPNDTANSSLIKYEFTSEHFPTTTSRLKYFHLASNPFYLKFNDRNLCIFSNRLINSYAKNLIHSKTDMNTIKLMKNNTKTLENFFESIGRLILSNSHLTAGINRNFTNLLSLQTHQSIDSIIFTDYDLNLPYLQCRPFESKSSTQFATAKSFSKDSFKFLVYYSNENHFEQSQINI